MLSRRQKLSSKGGALAKARYLTKLLAFAISVACAGQTAASTHTDKLSVDESISATEVMFAPTVNTERKGKWLGGAPPLNKRAAKISTFCRMEAMDDPNQIKVTLRFEGAKHDDAQVQFRPIDGAKFAQEKFSERWRLMPNTTSQISFTVIVPPTLSYLTLHTSQNNKGASRAFILAVPSE